jgi:hypothetical protein
LTNIPTTAPTAMAITGCRAAMAIVITKSA